MNNNSSSRSFLVLLSCLLCASAISQQPALVSQTRVPQQTSRASTKHASGPRAFASVSGSSPKTEVQLESMIQVAQAENQANLLGPFSRYGADLMRFAPHQQAGMFPGVFGNPVNAFQVPNAFDAQSAFHSTNFQPGGYQNTMSFMPSAFHGSGTLNAALQSSATHLAPITVTHGTTQEEEQQVQSLPAANFGGFSATPQFGSYPQDRQSNSGFQISQDLPGTHFPVTILPTGNFGQSPVLPTYQQVNAAAQPGQHWPNFFGQTQGNVAPYRFEKTRTPLVNTFQTIPASPQVGTKTFYPALAVPQENEAPKQNEQSEDDEEGDDEESDDDENEHSRENNDDDDEDEEESKTQAFQANINKNWCDVNPLCKKQQKSSTDSVEQVTHVPVSDYWDHVRTPYQYPSADAGAHGSEQREHKTTQKRKNSSKSSNKEELIPGYHRYNYEVPEEFMKEYDDIREEEQETTNTKTKTAPTYKKTTNKYQ